MTSAHASASAFARCTWGLEKNPALAVELSVSLDGRACRANYANGCVNLGFAHVHGRGVAKDLAKAVDYFHRACGLGTACDHEKHYRAQLAEP